MATSPSQPQAKSRKGGPTPTSETRTSTVATPTSGFTQGQGASTGRDNSSIFDCANEEFHHFMPAEIDTSYTGDVSDNDFEDARQFRNDSAVGRMEEAVQDKSKAKHIYSVDLHPDKKPTQKHVTLEPDQAEPNAAAAGIGKTLALGVISSVLLISAAYIVYKYWPSRNGCCGKSTR